ncbi:hypothetical protein VNI00_004301 [Paramarasmius palmivorus]|uniref:Cytochrome P450 n=1 Tax=Paramarasmius palmivorus TaxID=297713 RepID=A0AAW0DME9_9AGAR
MNTGAVKLFRPQQIKATNLLLSQILKTPESYLELLQCHSTRTIMSIAYGVEVKLHNDPWVSIVEDAAKSVKDAFVPGAFLVDFFPILKFVPWWFPGAGFKRKARKWKELAHKSLHLPHEAAQKIIESGEYSPSFVSESLQALSDVDSPTERRKKEQLIRETAGVMYIVGVESTTVAIAAFMFAMLVSPEAQRRAQEEVDRVAPGRLPTFEDEQFMPYVTAVVWESLRLKNVGPIGVPHYSDAEDVYNGYRIPKGSIVISNIWAILHDENLYPEPFEFKLERYFKPGKDYEFDETVRPPTFAAFGFGRRICPGRHMAYASLWIAVASILKTFDIVKAVDEQGIEIEPVYKLQSTFVGMPFPFECVIKPRSDEAKSLILAANGELEV